MINIIAAVGKNRELGAKNKLLWHIPADMEHFKTKTEGNVVIMGRKTFESLPKKFRPLPNRINIVVTRDTNYQINEKNVFVCHSIEDAIEKGKEFNKEVFIIGGAQIYRSALKYTDKLYLTLVDRGYPEADVFFPDYSDFKKKTFEEDHSSGDLKFKFIELVK